MSAWLLFAASFLGQRGGDGGRVGLMLTAFGTFGLPEASGSNGSGGNPPDLHFLQVRWGFWEAGSWPAK